MAEQQLYERVRVTIHEFDDAVAEQQVGQFTRMTPMIDVLEMMGGLPVDDQVVLLSNLLTISGHTQSEIADALGIAHKTYRNKLWEIRKDMMERNALHS